MLGPSMGLALAALGPAFGSPKLFQTILSNPLRGCHSITAAMKQKGRARRPFCFIGGAGLSSKLAKCLKDRAGLAIRFCSCRQRGATLRGEDFLAHAVAQDERIFKLNRNL